MAGRAPRNFRAPSNLTIKAFSQYRLTCLLFQELEFPALAFPPNGSVSFPPKWRPSTSDSSLPESTSSMSPRSRESSTRFLGHEDLDGPRPSLLYTPCEEATEEGVVIKHHPLSHAQNGPNHASPSLTWILSSDVTSRA